MELPYSEEPAEYQVMAVDSNGAESFMSNPVSVMPENGSLIVEAENFNIQAENGAEGFSGSGYVRFSLENKRDLIVKISAVAGRYALRMRYANGTGPVNTDNNCGIRSLYVNGAFAGPLIFPQRGLDEWSDWGLTNVEWITLKSGENLLTVKYDDFNRNMDGEINEFLLDYISLERYPSE